MLAGFYVCLALGLMSKGLIGLFFPLAIGGLFALLTRDARFWRFFLNPLAWLGLAAVVLPWFWLMELHNPGFLQFHLVNEQISRFLGQRFPPDMKSFSLSGFWLFTLVWLMPWTPFLPAALHRRPAQTLAVAGPGRCARSPARALGGNHSAFFQPFLLPDRIL